MLASLVNLRNVIDLSQSYLRDLRESGGTIVTAKSAIEVPKNVDVGVLFAKGASGGFLREAQDVFNDAGVHAELVEWENVEAHAVAAMQRLVA